ncbi:hypothetical protein INT45_011962 [Circinella minor]|uniref:F-box domain-containing protein n=1 Tax=Circinella minor TaxID=1195481 RepID=A0A8H7SCS6_9FUNG|nr:hypothetical protein INT45_011962 [Circinella minor]
MSTTSPVTTATTIINTATPISSSEKFKNADNHGDYPEIIRQVTNTITHIEQLEFLLMLEHRAHALSMKSNFGAATQEAETMIKYAPTLPQGYLWYGKVLSMQGKQARALKVYQEGLIKVSTNDLAYGQLLQAKKMADEKNNQHFDFVSALPLEVKEEIVKLLSEEERSNLFDVSTTWSQWLENCEKAWKYIYNDHGHDGNIAVSQVLPKVAKHINHLTIPATMKEVWLKYLELLENGHFRNLKSLKLTCNDEMRKLTSNDFAFGITTTIITITGDMIPNLFCANSVMSLMNGFWKTRYTLTKINFMFSENGSPITITDILFHLPYLETLIFVVKDPLADILGELETLQEPHRSLIDLTLSSYPTTGDALKPLTKWCPYVRRLALEVATPGVLDIVNDYFPNVEMLGYNYYFKLPTLHEVLNQDYNNNEPIIPIISMNNMYNKQEQGRLRAFYSNNGGQGVPGDAFLRLLQKNQKTLEIIHANMTITKQQDIDGEPYDNYRPDYARKAASVVLNLDRLQKIMFWPDIYGVYEPFFCRMIGPSLKYFKSVETSDLFAVVDALISSQQILETLGFAQIRTMNNDLEHTLATQCWVRLFNNYAAKSLPRLNTTKKLRNVMLDYCYTISDDILDALADIKTIKGLSFQGNSRITRQGFKNFFTKLNKQNVQITKLKLGGMKDVVDSNTLLDIVSTVENLEVLHLNDLDGLTDNDIKALVHIAKKLNTLVVKRCGVYSENIVAFLNNTNRQFKYMKIIEYHDDDEDIFNFDFDTFN